MLLPIATIDLLRITIVVKRISSWPPHRFHNNCSIVQWNLFDWGTSFFRFLINCLWISIFSICIEASNNPSWCSSISLIIFSNAFQSWFPRVFCNFSLLKFFRFNFFLTIFWLCFFVSSSSLFKNRWQVMEPHIHRSHFFNCWFYKLTFFWNIWFKISVTFFYKSEKPFWYQSC